MASQSRERIVQLCSALGHAHLEGGVHLWALQYKKGIKLLKSIQRRKMIKSLEGKPNGGWLRSLGLFGLGKTDERPHCGPQFPYEGKRRGRH